MSSTVPVLPPNLKVKRVDYYYSRWSKAWKYKNMGDKITAEMTPIGSSSGGNDQWQQYCFVVVRTLPREEDQEPTFSFIIKSPYLLQACKDVIQYIPGLSWNADPVTLQPNVLLAFLPEFEKYYDDLKRKKNRSQEENHIMTTTGILIDYLRKEYKLTLGSFSRLTSHGEITFDLIQLLMVPRSTLITTCPVTREPRALDLILVTRVQTMCGFIYDLLCESVDAVDEASTNTTWPPEHSGAAEVRKADVGRAFGRVRNRMIIAPFSGTVKITSLDSYPIAYHANEKELRDKLVARGRKWASLAGIHHTHYNGTAAFVVGEGSTKKYVKYSLNSRIMIDRKNFRRLNPNYEFPQLKNEQADQKPTPSRRRLRDLPPPTAFAEDPNIGIPTLHVSKATEDLEASMTDNDFLLATTTLYGFSLADKLWLEFNVEQISPIEWNDEAFTNLVLPSDRKTLLQSLVEAHNNDLGFDDFVQGKGHGLVINLFGPPGVGKTLSAEATSEHVRRPLYVVGGGDVGTNAGALDKALQQVFDIATSWKAIVLIDEADVFLEERSLHDLERNAMVAVFLRHIEYYRGILFLTTNRVKTFDEAFLSRIHVALHFQELTKDAKVQVWKAFLRKVGVEIGGPDFGEESIEKLAARNINGRQIKNATRTASSLSASRKEKLSFRHLVQTLDAMDEFNSEFRALNRQG
ncbi:P-loop containing nucleoside triphosphate hydrolase protein [Irpex rosettiformis]|uniref:P-loop containing nucleoside triphosphate hydrolase protein n=1 Tax=Irpex rosettiformis TaxID=378272 RepID=A0ACB8U2B7_9APHY|nr:P-loop containing nucleoside triphosphate hydrolase protein [Irpex rosettiformis]